jgi:hypothetical protein
MRLLAISLAFVLAALFPTTSAIGQEPGPTPDVKVPTEEVLLKIEAFDRLGNVVMAMTPDDVVIRENDRLLRPTSIRKIPASVLIALDTGGEIRQKKNIVTTRRAGQATLQGIDQDAEVSVMHFHEKAEMLSGWGDARSEHEAAIGSRTKFGRRASFTDALTLAVDTLKNAPTENRHLVLITDGLDSGDTPEKRNSAIAAAWASGITIHILSYTQIEFESLKPQAKVWRKGEPKPRRMPDEVMEALIASLPMKRADAIDFLNQVYPPRLLSVITDLPFLRDRKTRLRSLTESHTQLSSLAEFSGGTILLPETLDELVEKAEVIVKAINSRLIVAYEPATPIDRITEPEIRQITVSSRDPDLRIEGSRRLILAPISGPEPQ